MIKDYTKYEMNQREKLIFTASGYVIIGAAVFLFYHSLILSIIAGGCILWLAPLYEDFMVLRRYEKLDIQFKDLLYSLSASVAAGRQMGEALIEADSNLKLIYRDEDLIMVELSHMCTCIIENNESDAALLIDFADRAHSEDISNFVQVYITCRDLGGDLEQIIQRTAGILNDKMTIRREIKSITAQRKLEGRMIAMMPVIMLALLNIASPSYIAPMYETFIGRLIMTFCLAASCWAIWMMEKLSSVEI